MNIDLYLVLFIKTKSSKTLNFHMSAQIVLSIYDTMLPNSVDFHSKKKKKLLNALLIIKCLFGYISYFLLLKFETCV